MDLKEIKEVFFTESSDLLQRIESTLLSLESDPTNPRERLDDLFRCVHTIKGSAGIFGFERIVKFTHHLEEVLDELREGINSLTSESIALFLDCRDYISEIIEDIANQRDSKDKDDLEKTLLEKLKHYQKKEPPPIEAPPVEPIALEIAKQTIYKSPEIIQEILKPEVPSLEEEPERKNLWHISVRFKENTFKHGLDPFPVFKYLQKHGEIINLFTLTHNLPELEDWNPEACYLGFELVYKSEKDKNFIEEAFEFVKFDTDLIILHPERTAEDICEFLSSRTERKLRLIKILLYIGAITPRELKAVLDLHRVRKDFMSSPTSNLPKQVPVQTTKNNIQDSSIEKIKEIKTKPTSKDSKTIRVDLSKLDHLINLVGELVISSANLNQYSISKQDESLQEIVFHLNQLISELRDSALNLRMVPIGETFNRFQRVVRDICNELGKEVDLKITGGETELDKSVVEKITDPLTHLVRNALDHGIEDKEERIKLGKIPKGILHLHAYHETGSIVIEVKDDGRGLSKEKIYKKAQEKNLINSTREYSEDEIFRFIFLPGFSTAEKVTNLSGRGVGMDVVLKNIESLRGTVNILSKEKEGTTIQVRLPLTLAIIDGFLFQVGTSYFVVPLEQVVECVEFKPEFLNGENKDIINLRGHPLPFFALSNLFFTQNIPSKKTRKNILVVRYMQREVGLLVDSLLGEFQTVIKPLGKIFTNLKGVAGSTVLGNGEVALVLDLPSIFQLVIEREQEKLKKNRRET